MNTPLPFMLWGWLERLFHGGIVAARHLNFALSFAIALTVAGNVRLPPSRDASPDRRSLGGGGQPDRESDWHAARSAVGLLAFPYFLGTSIHLYTDIMAAFFALCGVIFHLRRRYVLSAIAFILGISSRQVIVAFPIALLAFELVNVRSSAVPQGFSPVILRRWHRASALFTGALIAPLAAASSFIGWVLLFGGFGPPSELEAQAALIGAPFALHPEHALFFLTTIGLYFVIPELLLFGFTTSLSFRPAWHHLALVAALLIAFVVFPPLNNPVTPAFGLFDSVVRRVLSDPWRVALYFVLAAGAALRLLREPLPLLVVCANAAVLIGANFGWEKYAVPALVVSWYLKSRQEI